MDYKGVIIEESLIDRSIIDDLEILQTEVANTTAREQTPWLSKWTLQTVIIKEDEIEDYTKKLSNLIDTKHIGCWYCDFRNNEYHYIVFSNKVFKLDRTKKQDYLKMKEYALSIGLPEHQLPEYNDLPINLLIGFLLEAKKQTYAAGISSKTVSSRLGSNDYRYEEEIEGETMIYHDTFFGTVRFIGEEVIYRGSNKPKWAMNYYGVTLDESLSEETMDKVLRPALGMVGEDTSVLPVRGPSIYEEGGYTYRFMTEGKIENFTGTEEIYKDNKLIYILKCHGGLVE